MEELDSLVVLYLDFILLADQLGSVPVISYLLKMDWKAPFRFLDLPVEIQQLILRACLNGWKAKVETHEKPEQKKQTTRIWSSHIYDNLMLSLTCKYFHQTIQEIQQDPSLFSGELDLIEANADLGCILGLCELKSTHSYAYYENEYLATGSDQQTNPPSLRAADHGEVVSWLYKQRPSPFFRTKIFIKSQPYDRSEPNWQLRKDAYHNRARQWLVRYVQSLGIWIDEIQPYTPWTNLPRLNHVTIYWPYAAYRTAEINKPICRWTPDEMVTVAKNCTNYQGDWERDITLSTILRQLQSKGVRITLQLEMPHLHHTGDEFMKLKQALWDDYPDTCSDFHKLECAFTVQGDDWSFISARCCDEKVEINVYVAQDILDASWMPMSDDDYNDAY